MRLDAHNYGRRIELFFKKLDKNESMCLEDKEILKRYRDCLISEGITLGRVSKYLGDLKKASWLLEKKFSDAVEQDIRRIVSLVDSNENFSPWTKRDFKIAIRKFYTWLRGTKDYPSEVAWLKIYSKIRNDKTHEDILTEEEIKRLIEFSPGVQDKAFISTLYESGCRIGELIYLKMKQVRFDDYGAQLFLNGKTGFRRVRVLVCVPYLQEWMNKHPFKEEPGAYLWVNNRLKPFSYSSIVAMLYRTASRAGIVKKVNPHNFRHSRASYLASFLTEAQMKEYFGWTQDSKMAAVYVHLSGRDVDNALLKVYGIENNDVRKESILKPKKCSRCDLVNQPTNRFCSGCGMSLDEESATKNIRAEMERKEADNILDNLLEDQEFREMFMRKIADIKSKK